MALIGALNILLSANTDKFSKGIKEAQGSLAKLQAFATSTQGAITAFGAAIGAGAVIKQVVDLANESFKLADDLAALGAKTGLTVKSLSELRYIATRSDVDFETLAQSVKKLNVNLVEAAHTGKGGTHEALKQLGLDAAQLAAAGADNALLLIAEGISKVENPAEQAALAMDLFGKAGVEMLPLLQNGRAGIEELRAEAVRLGVVLGDEQAAMLNEANDAWDKLTFAVEGFGNALAVLVAPAVTDVTERLTEQTAAVSANGKGLTDTLGSVVSVTAFVVDGFDLLFDILRTNLGLLASTAEAPLFIFQGIGQGIDWIVKKVTGFNLGLGGLIKTYKDWAGSIRENNIGALFNTELTPGEKLQTWFDGVASSASMAAKEINKTPQALSEVAEATKRATDDGKKLIEKLQEQVRYFGMSSNQAEIWKLHLSGASPAVVQQAVALDKQLKALEATKKKHEDAAKAAQEYQQKLKDSTKSVLDEIATPAQKFRDKMREIDELARNGMLTPEQYKKARMQAGKDAFGEKEINLGDGKRKLSDALTAGSGAARDAILKAQGLGPQRDPAQQAQLEASRNAWVEQQKSRLLLEKIEKALRGEEVTAF